MFRIVARNMLSNWTGYMVQFAVMFFLTPLVVAELGESRYGIWVFCSSFTGYYGLLDLGLRPGITQFLARNLGTGNTLRVNQVASSGLASMLVVGLLTLLLGIGLATLSPLLLKGSSEFLGSAYWCIVIFACSAAWQAVCAPFSSLFVASQRYDLSNAIGITTRLLTALGVYFVLQAGHGLVPLSLVVAGGNVVDYALRVVVAFRIVPQLSVRLSLVSRENIQEILSFGGWNFLITISQSVFEYADVFVIAALLGPHLITPYALASRVVSNGSAMLRSLAMVFYPTLAQLHAREDHANFRRLYLVGTRILLSITCVAFTLGWVWCDDFFRLWIDADSLSPDTRAMIPIVFRLLLLCMLVEQMPRIGTQVMLASHRPRPLALIYGTEAVANVLLSCLLAVYWGLYGVAVATLVTISCARLAALPVQVHRVLQLPHRVFLSESVARPLAFGVLLMLTALLLHSLVPVESWSVLFSQGLAVVLIAALLGWTLVLLREERQRVLQMFVARLIRRSAPGSR